MLPQSRLDWLVHEAEFRRGVGTLVNRGHLETGGRRQGWAIPREVLGYLLIWNRRVDRGRPSRGWSSQRWAVLARAFGRFSTAVAAECWKARPGWMVCSAGCCVVSCLTGSPGF